MKHIPYIIYQRNEKKSNPLRCYDATGRQAGIQTDTHTRSVVKDLKMIKIIRIFTNYKHLLITWIYLLNLSSKHIIKSVRQLLSKYHIVNVQ